MNLPAVGMLKSSYGPYIINILVLIIFIHVCISISTHPSNHLCIYPCIYLSITDNHRANIFDHLFHSRNGYKHINFFHPHKTPDRYYNNSHFKMVTLRHRVFM